MPGKLQLLIQDLNEKHLHACAWILWEPVGTSEFQIVSQSGFETANLQQITAAWEGHDELLQQVFTTKTIRRASANSEQIQKSNSATISLLVAAVISQDKVTSLLELFFQDPEQLEVVLQDNSLEKSLSQIAEVFSTDISSTPMQQHELADYLAELVSQTAPERLPHVISNAICARYEVGRCSLFSLADQSVRLQGISGHPDCESRSEIIRQLHEVVRNHASSLSVQNSLLSLSKESLDQLKSESAYLIWLDQVFLTTGSKQRQFAVMLVEYFEKNRDDLLEQELLETLPLWKIAIQSSRPKLSGAGQSSKRTTFMSLIVLAIICLLVFLRVDLTIRASGQVVPATRHHLFAPESGLIKIEDLHLPASGEVSAKQHLLTITNQELTLQLSQQEGKIATLTEEIRSLKNRRPERISERSPRMTIDQDVSIRLAQISTQLAGLQKEKKLLEQRIESLKILSPHRGTLLSWDAEHQLAGRPVTRGQLLLTIGDSEGEWEVLADVAENDLGPLNSARAQKVIPFTMKLDADSNRKWEGTLTTISPIVLQQTSDEFVLPVTGRLSRKITGVLPGSRITMRISCGKHPLGYVLFRGPIDTIRNFISW